MQHLLNYYRLVRPVNLLIVAATMLLVYRLLIISNDAVSIEHFDLLALVIINTMIIMAGGNVVNDIFDINADRHNKTLRWYVGNVIPKRAASLFYLSLLALALAISFAIFAQTSNTWLLFIFLTTMILLFGYSSGLKKIPLIANMLIACLCALSLWIVPITFSFDAKYLLPLSKQVQSLLLAITFFAWLTTLMREVVKDVQDIKGDSLAKTQTLAHLFSPATLKKILLILALIILLVLVTMTSVWSKKLPFSAIIYLYGLVLGALFLLYHIYRLKKPADWSRMSLYLKIYMVQGLLFLGLIS